MNSRIKKFSIFLLTHLAALLFGAAILYFASAPVGIWWEFFFGSEINSRTSFPRGHSARIYSAWGFGEQSLVFIVDGTRVYWIDDFAPGNIQEDILWDESGTVVTFKAFGGKIYEFDTKTRTGATY